MALHKGRCIIAWVSLRYLAGVGHRAPLKSELSVNVRPQRDLSTIRSSRQNTYKNARFTGGSPLPNLKPTPPSQGHEQPPPRLNYSLAVADGFTGSHVSSHFRLFSVMSTMCPRSDTPCGSRGYTLSSVGTPRVFRARKNAYLLQVPSVSNTGFKLRRISLFLVVMLRGLGTRSQQEHPRLSHRCKVYHFQYKIPRFCVIVIQISRFCVILIHSFSVLIQNS